MGQSLVKNLLHLVYSTKHRNLWIPAEVQEGLYSYQSGVFKNWGSPALVIGGVESSTQGGASQLRCCALPLG